MGIVRAFDVVGLQTSSSIVDPAHLQNSKLSVVAGAIAFAKTI